MDNSRTAISIKGKPMNKSDLIDALALDQNLPIKTAEAIVAIVLGTITGTLVNSSNIENRGFGGFTVRKYQAYDGRNPKTGKKFGVKPKKLPFFKVGKELREDVNRSKA
jgi:integration host factor subunit beta